VLGATAAILVLALFVAGLRSYRDLSVQRARQAALVERIADTKVRIEQLEQQIELLKTDPGTLERVAREDLGMTRPGDIVIRVKPVESEEQTESPPDS
jgi:cell division protein FtsB